MADEKKDEKKKPNYGDKLREMLEKADKTTPPGKRKRLKARAKKMRH